ncbi:hypothetical protein EBZ38_17225 [bacterium]|nr:hypothetical protein [bacterium]NDD86003.1 hypothetical protein [bacterium]NDG26609.1 hypothetical protein [Pseudomonadota bacterium]
MQNSRKGIGGRPTKYKPEYCSRLIELCAQGLSRRALCAEIGISTETFYDWVKKIPEFSDAYRKGEAAASHFYESKMLEGGLGRIKGFNVMALTFLMKNRYPKEFRDKQDVELSGNESHPIKIETSEAAQSLTDAELKKRLKDLLKEP